MPFLKPSPWRARSPGPGGVAMGHAPCRRRRAAGSPGRHTHDRRSARAIPPHAVGTRRVLRPVGPESAPADLDALLLKDFSHGRADRPALVRTELGPEPGANRVVAGPVDVELESAGIGCHGARKRSPYPLLRSHPSSSVPGRAARLPGAGRAVGAARDASERITGPLPADSSVPSERPALK